MSANLEVLDIENFLDVTDYVANGSFASLKENVEYKDRLDYAILVRLADHNRGWSGNYVYVTERAYKFLRKSVVEPGDVIISNVGANAGTVFRAPNLGMPMTLGPNSVLLKPKEDQPYLTDYIYYFFVSPKGQHLLKSILSGSAQPKFNKTDLRSSKIEIPKNRDYSSVVKIFVALDKKISLNHKINQNLEQIAQAIFKSWFVDFEPVKAKIAAKENSQDPERAAIRAISGKSDAELNQLPADQLSQLATTAALFPDELVDSERGLIPNGWQVLKSSDLCDVRDGTHDSPKQSPKGKYLITSKHITGGMIDHSKAYLISETAFEQVNQRSKVDSYDILLTMIGTVGVSLLVLEDTIDFAIKNIGLFKVGRDKRLAVFIFLYLKTTFMTQFLESRIAGTTQKYLTLKTLRSIPVLTPSDEIIKCFGDNVLQIFKKIHENNAQNNNLTQLRDTLLPKLLSGEITVAETQAKIEAAV